MIDGRSITHLTYIIAVFHSKHTFTSTKKRGIGKGITQKGELSFKGS